MGIVRWGAMHRLGIPHHIWYTSPETEAREIQAALETVYREHFPQLNLRQWSGAIYTWLTHPYLIQPAVDGS